MSYDPELEPDAVSYIWTIIGIQRWTTELGRIDKIAEMSLLSSHVALPREEHVAAAYLKEQIILLRSVMIQSWTCVQSLNRCSIILLENYQYSEMDN